MTRNELDEIDKKVCVVCKKPILDRREYLCLDCYETANKKVQEMGNAPVDNVWSLLLILGIFAFDGKGKENYELLDENK